MLRGERIRAKGRLVAQGLTGQKATRIYMNGFCYFILICIVFLILYPFFSHIAACFKSGEDLLDESVLYIPREPNLARIKMVNQLMKYATAFLNTTLLPMACGVLQTLSCLAIGYGFARYAFPLKRVLFGLVILTMIIPIQVIMTSLFVGFMNVDVFGLGTWIFGQPLNTIDTPIPFLILSVFGLGFKNGLYIFLFRQFFRGMPNELEEAALIDGTGYWGVFSKIMLPNAWPMMITVFLFSFSWQWTDSYYTLIFFKEHWVLSVALSYLKTYQGVYFDPAEGAAVLSTGLIFIVIPLFVLYAFLQKFFIQGIEHSGIVG